MLIGFGGNHGSDGPHSGADTPWIALRDAGDTMYRRDRSRIRDGRRCCRNQQIISRGRCLFAVPVIY